MNANEQINKCFEEGDPLHTFRPPEDNYRLSEAGRSVVSLYFLVFDINIGAVRRLY